MEVAATRLTCLKLHLADLSETIFVQGTWFDSRFDLSITNGLQAWLCHASDDQVRDRAAQWDQSVPEYIDFAQRHLGFQHPGSLYNFADAGDGCMRLSWTFEKEGTKLEWRWKCQLASDSKRTIAGILDSLMDANIRLSDKVVKKTESYERLKMEAEKCVAQSESFANDRTEFESAIYVKFVGVLNSKKAKLRELRDRYSKQKNAGQLRQEEESTEETESLDDGSEMDKSEEETAKNATSTSKRGLRRSTRKDNGSFLIYTDHCNGNQYNRSKLEEVACSCSSPKQSGQTYTCIIVFYCLIVNKLFIDSMFRLNLQYIATLREQLEELTEGRTRQGVLRISKAKAIDYSDKIEAIASKIAAPLLEEQVAEEPFSIIASPSEAKEDTTVPKTPVLRRRFVPSSDDAMGYDTSQPVKLDATAHAHIEKHRKLQDDLTDEMVGLARRLKETSLTISQSVQNTEKILDSTEEAVEHSLARTGHTNARAMSVHSQNSKTSCFTCLLIFTMTCVFFMAVLLIRAT